jgi:crotonobetainyl-CoA:carnitine CoA-transferase CaiB-like acyl-CoA transferase
MSETPGSKKGDPPSLGEANTDVLRRVGLDEKEIEEINAVAESTREEAFQALAQLRDS